MAVLYDALCDDSRLVRFAQDLKLEDQIEVDVAVLCLSISHQRELASFAVTQAELEVTDLPLLDVYLEILGTFPVSFRNFDLQVGDFLRTHLLLLHIFIQPFQEVFAIRFPISNHLNL